MARSSLRVLALVTDAFGGGGGIAQYNRDFLRSLAQGGCIGDVIVLPRASATVSNTLPAGVRQLRPVNGRLLYSLTALQIAKAYWPIDIVFCGHLFMVPLAAVIAKVLRSPLWVQVHGVDAWEELSLVYRRAIERAALITSVSRYTRQRLLDWVTIDPTRVKILPNTVSPQFCPGPKPTYLLERYAVGRSKVLLTVSRLASADRYKGIDRVIQALPQILMQRPETIYIIVGDGDDRPQLEKLAGELGVAEKVCFVGHAKTQEMPDHFRLADVFVMASTKEGFGIVFLEAMASGIPVIGGNRDGSLDPLADGVLGRAVDPCNGEELTSAICTALSGGPVEVDLVDRFNLQGFTKHLQALVCSNLLAGH